MADPGHIDAVLADGAERARAIARRTMDAVKDIVGFLIASGLLTSLAEAVRAVRRTSKL